MKAQGCKSLASSGKPLNCRYKSLPQSNQLVTGRFKEKHKHGDEHNYNYENKHNDKKQYNYEHHNKHKGNYNGNEYRSFYEKDHEYTRINQPNRHFSLDILQNLTNLDLDRSSEERPISEALLSRSTSILGSPFASEKIQYPEVDNTFESFEITFLGSLKADLDLTYSKYLNGFSFITSLSEALIFISTILVAMITIMRKKPLLKSINFDFILIKLYLFIFNLVKEIVANKVVTNLLLPIILSLAYSILSLNLLGLFPFAFSATGHLIFTMTLSFITFLGGVVLALKILKLDYFAIFIPHNCPPALLPVVTIIETMSYIIRPFSLGIRLFANMLSGHILLSIIYNNFVNTLISKSLVLISLAAGSIAAFFSLETLIAFIQTYVFCILTTLFFAENLEDRSWGQH